MNFLQYVVSELKSKRLGKENALALIKQFSERSSSEPQIKRVHPLLDANISDFEQQSYCVTFNGDEFFLTDHQLDGQKILPAVVYLEMARAAIDDARKLTEQQLNVSLHHVVWAQPVIVTHSKELFITLFAAPEDDGSFDRLEFEIYSLDPDGQQAMVHCQGQAKISSHPLELESLELSALSAQMTGEPIQAQQLYQDYQRAGMEFGPAHQGISEIKPGQDQQLAWLQLPTHLALDGPLLLHPSLLDGALQATKGLLPANSLPFALASLVFHRPLTEQLVVWLRYSQGSHSTDSTVKLDIDLCDPQGQVLVQLQGFSTRAINPGQAEAEVSSRGTLYGVPQWKNSPSVVQASEFEQRYLLVPELPQVDFASLRSRLTDIQVKRLSDKGGDDLAEFYQHQALECFDFIKALLSQFPQTKMLLQLVVAQQSQQQLLLGLAPMLQSAVLENPNLTTQLLLVDSQISTDTLAEPLQSIPSGAVVRLAQDTVEQLYWQTKPEPQDMGFGGYKTAGVYLITGGMGGLGMLMAQQVLDSVEQSTVIISGRGALTEQRQEQLDQLGAEADRVHYYSLDLSQRAEVEQLISQIIHQHGRLNGIFHCAGMVADDYIVNKDSNQFAQVLIPKVAGTVNLDWASRAIELDFLLLFSSISGALGNPGQADYAAANGFMDQFAAYRHALVEKGQRQGQSLSINWPLWGDGGMSIDLETEKLLLQSSGMVPMDTDTGLKALNYCLNHHDNQLLVVSGELDILQQTLNARMAGPQSVEIAHVSHEPQLDDVDLTAQTQAYLTQELSQILQLPAHQIDPQAAMEKYGIDSILTMDLTNKLEKTFGVLSKTLFYEYQTLAQLSGYFITYFRPKLEQLFATDSGVKSDLQQPQRANEPVATPVATKLKTAATKGKSVKVKTARAATTTQAIAIVGLSGRYPQADDLEKFWQNLKQGQDSITQIPTQRWDWHQYYSEDRTQAGRHYSKWGGFISGVSEFDPLFFNIPPVEAETIDPQERLFLQYAWHAIEDAGFNRAGLQSHEAHGPRGLVGVYVGVMYGEYQLLGAEATLKGQPMAFSGNLASIANRVSYVLNLHGPSMMVDTMCSSSLTAIHLACQDLNLNHTHLAIAGGVNVTIHPNKYLMLSAGQFISSDGRCQSFGEGGDGYIPGEGVGAVVLQRLDDAKAQGRHIYGLIKGSALSHGGKTNGPTVPNPQAQSSAISQALAQAGVEPRHISYIEAHGTGTKLGDPIEIAALSKSFYPSDGAREYGFCAIGSVKSNIGHCESAAGIAGLTKILLQMKHQQLVPSLHSQVLNPHIDFEHSPFVVTQQLQRWEQPVVDGRTLPRLAGISSFGAGGSNAHLIVEQHIQQSKVTQQQGMALIPLAGRTAEQLQQLASNLVNFIEANASTIALRQLAYTLQVGREPQPMRLGLLVDSVEQLGERLRAWLEGKTGLENVYQGQSETQRQDMVLLGQDDDMQVAIDNWMKRGKLAKLIDIWVKGLDLEWLKLYPQQRPMFMSLPGYPFATDSYWVDVAATGVGVTGQPQYLHPLLQINNSDLGQQRYASCFNEAQSLVKDHQLDTEQGQRQKVLPAVAYLEMARAAIANAVPVAKSAGIIEIRNISWSQPLVVAGDTQVELLLTPAQAGEVEFSISSGSEELIQSHCQGVAGLIAAAPLQAVDIDQLSQQMQAGELSGAKLYQAYADMGVHYGEGYQGVERIYLGEDQLLAVLKLTAGSDPQGACVLDPGIMDSALQSAIGLFVDMDQLPSDPAIPFALDCVRVYGPSTGNMYAWLRRVEQGNNPALIKLDIDLYDQQGQLCIQLLGLNSRTLKTQQAAETFIAIPQWQPQSLSEPLARNGEVKAQLLLLDFDSAQVEQLQQQLQHCQCHGFNLPQQLDRADIHLAYGHYAQLCFEHLQQLVNKPLPNPVLLQLVIKDEVTARLSSGLTALLKTAALEQPALTVQSILVEPEVSVSQLAKLLVDEQAQSQSQVRYLAQQRQVLNWQQIEFDPQPEQPYQQHGVYLITGGLGGLGGLFAQHILASSSEATVVLTGRRELSEQQWQQKQQQLADDPQQQQRLVYQPMDLSKFDSVAGSIEAICRQQGPLKGLIHSAGMTHDGLLRSKTLAQFEQVLNPKVNGSHYLDLACADLDLDFMVLFSSGTAVLGNAGQGDYAAANGFIDQFAEYRNALVASGKRQGHTLSINWPLWKHGGMTLDQQAEQALLAATAMVPLATEIGLKAFDQALRSGSAQLMVAQGDPNRLAALLQQKPPVVAPIPEPTVQPTTVQEARTDEAEPPQLSQLTADTEAFLKQTLAQLLKMSPSQINPKAELEDYGIDSVLAMSFTNQLEKTFGSLSKTLMFEYQTISQLAGYFIEHHPQQVLQTFAPQQHTSVATAAPSNTVVKAETVSIDFGSRRFATVEMAQTQAVKPVTVAIVGLSGRYPQADDLDMFWQNLLAGRDSIVEIPSSRWDHGLYFDPEKGLSGKSYSKWGGFINGVDEFDPLLFNISPKEAILMDPQERLFLQTVWQTFEDAGYGKDHISGGNIGVYVGVMWGQYDLYGAEALLTGAELIPGSSYASIANRVSYFFNLSGPSIALDTMCSSSLTAIHMASEAIIHGEIDAAIAGGVNLTIHPHKYVNLSQGGFQSTDGRCRSFGAGGDGYVSGEGVGAILLKPLEAAQAQGDHIYALIKSTSINHGGKTNGYSVPNPNAQGQLIKAALDKAGIQAQSLGYLEAHGTGTALGDPIEISGLVKAFAGANCQNHSIAIGSVKSNIGHLEAAAGIAAMTKVILQMQQQMLVPSLHAQQVNPNIDFSQTPFYVNTKATSWPQPQDHGRRAGISSFGAGGANAHVIIEQFNLAAPQASNEGLAQAFLLSAKDPQGLLTYAQRMHDFMVSNSQLSLADLAFTSQLGRTQMNERLVIVATSVEQLRDTLALWLEKSSAKQGGYAEIDHCFSGNLKQAQGSTSELVEGAAGTAFIQVLYDNRDWHKLAKLWLAGISIDWSSMHTHGRRISMPTYPFKTESYWPAAPLSGAIMTTEAVQSQGLDNQPEQALCYQSQWQAQPLEVDVEPSNNLGNVWYFETDAELIQQLQAAVGTKEQVWLAVKPDNPKGFSQFIAQAAENEQLPQVLIFNVDAAQGLQTTKAVEQQLQLGLYSLFELCQGLLQQKAMSGLKILLNYSADNDAGPLQAALGGFLKTLSLEDPRYQSKVVQWSPSPAQQLDTEDKAKLLLAELSVTPWQAQHIRYQWDEELKPRRLVQTLAPLSLEAVQPHQLPIKHAGCFIISGGLGGLGYLFSRYLLDNFELSLVLFGRSPLQGEQRQRFEQLDTARGKLLYVQADASKFKDMQRVVKQAKQAFGQVNGVIHSAGVNRDNFIVNKGPDELSAVVGAKVLGALNLDRATANEPIDWFMMFSSVAGALGNSGQCDYAYANHFIDAFAHYRVQLQHSGQRSGRSLSINWPYWTDGGMSLSEADIDLTRQLTGMSALATDVGIDLWQAILSSGVTQAVALYGVAAQIEGYINPQQAAPAAQGAVQTELLEQDQLLERTQQYLRELVGEQTKLDAQRIDVEEPFEAFGIDSVMVRQINSRLDNDFTVLPQTLLYEYETIEALSSYLIEHIPQPLSQYFNISAKPVAKPTVAQVVARKPMAVSTVSAVVNKPDVPSVSSTVEPDEVGPIAIIGLHGRYPQSEDLAQYWHNLCEGKDLITEVPVERWDQQGFYDPDPANASQGKIYAKWGGFLSDIDKFDAPFFNIDGAEANIIDPQERLFLESCWAAIEDAGYTPELLKRLYPKNTSADVGVFVGVTTNSYHLLAEQQWAKGNMVAPGALPWSIANRVSYAMDLQGPSMPIDTACSSCLVAIHMAVQSLRDGQCQLAIAGGVNLYLHHAKYHSLCQKRMLAQGPKCFSYGAGDDGFVPGEGVGSVVLKPLNDALKQGDHIYALLAATGYDHSGRASGYSAPNPNSQAAMVRSTLAKANIDPLSINYVEGHGTGTQLGDSLEVAALAQVFGNEWGADYYCALGSVKANAGHAESAAGIAGLTKVLLQLKHQQLVPTIHSSEVNPSIDFSTTPLRLQHQLSHWPEIDGKPRRALINSFGAGGVNAAIVVEEYRQAVVEPDHQGPYLVIISAKTDSALQAQAKQLLQYLQTHQVIDMAALAYTLQVGRQAMVHKLAVNTLNRAQLLEQMESWLQGSAASGVFAHMTVKRSGSKKHWREQDEQGFEQALGASDLNQIAQLWLHGAVLDWNKLYGATKPQRLSLPSYPFARKRYWLSEASPVAQGQQLAVSKTEHSSGLHPLLHRNISTLKGLMFGSTLLADGYYAVDHRVNGQMILPGAAFIEMACVAAAIAAERKVSLIRDIVWINPLSFAQGEQDCNTHLQQLGDDIEYEVTSIDDEQQVVVHAQGRINCEHQTPKQANIDLNQLISTLGAAKSGADLYQQFELSGLSYGPAFQTVKQYYCDGKTALVKLCLDHQLSADFDQYILHPSLIDGALQSVATLADADGEGVPYLPFALDQLELVAPLSQHCYALVEGKNQTQDNGMKIFDISLLDLSGQVQVRLNNLLVRALVQPPSKSSAEQGTTWDIEADVFDFEEG